MSDVSIDLVPSLKGSKRENKLNQVDACHVGGHLVQRTPLFQATSYPAMFCLCYFMSHLSPILTHGNKSHLISLPYIYIFIQPIKGKKGPTGSYKTRAKQTKTCKVAFNQLSIVASPGL